MERVVSEVRERLYSLAKKVQQQKSIIETEEATISDDRGIETTLEELEGFQIVRAITCSEVDPYRIVHRDTKSYFGILLDDNNRKPLARLHFNRTQKYIGVFDETKTETRYPIEALTDIYAHADKLRTTVHYYE